MNVRKGGVAFCCSLAGLCKLVWPQLELELGQVSFTEADKLYFCPSDKGKGDPGMDEIEAE